MPECCPCLNFEENPHAELNMYSFLFCFYYILSPRYLFAFRNIRRFFYSAHAKGRPCSLKAKTEFCSPLVYTCFICLRLHQEPLEFSCGELYRIFGSCHVVDISGSAVCSHWLFTVTSPSWFSKPGSSYLSMRFTVCSLLQQNTSAPREEALPEGSTRGEWDGWPGLCYCCSLKQGLKEALQADWIFRYWNEKMYILCDVKEARMPAEPE